MKNSCQPFQAVMKSEILPKWKEVQLWGSGRLKGSVEAVVDLLGLVQQQPTSQQICEKETLSNEMEDVPWMFHFFGGVFWKPGMFSNCFKLEITLPEEVWRFGGRFFLIRFGGL